MFAIFVICLGTIFALLATLWAFGMFFTESADAVAYLFLAIICGIISWLLFVPALNNTSRTDFATIHYAPSEIIRSEANDSTMITYTEFYSPTLGKTSMSESISFDKKTVTQGKMNNGFNSDRTKLFYTCADSNIVVTMNVTLNTWGEPLIKSLYLNHYSDKELKDITVLNADDVVSVMNDKVSIAGNSEAN